jgi:hypothetical protein
LRIALLLALAENPDAAGEKLTFRRFAGRSVLAHQIDAVLAMGCESEICSAASTMQRLAERNFTQSTAAVGLPV